ncbi:hypothetical protein BJX66DRAFT_327576 [Aspergillus keveii]|uniref:FAD-binding PCMH-type domain-containing protein n=1 Tax=Aspergillus keveii TaxID=714993 RepID=A0ABR4FWX6_9EURO
MKLCSVPSIPAVFQGICRITCYTALLNSALAPNIVLPSSPQYPDLVNKHYATSAPLQLACFFQPQSTEQVALGVSILVESDDGSPQCQFAICGGGHTPWKGAAGAEGGVTIDLALMNSTVYNPDTSSVAVMGGAKSGDVYKTLQPYGVAVTGGRSDAVGVGGFIIGGGLSYFGNKYGLACDNVLNFEVVLSNGQAITANHTSYPDLFRALKGGGNNLGIVTKVELRAFEQGPLRGGLVGHSSADISQQNRALVNLTSNLARPARTGRHNLELQRQVQDHGRSHRSPTHARRRNSRHLPRLPRHPTDIQYPPNDRYLRPHDGDCAATGERALCLTLTFENDVRVLEHLRTLHDESVEAATPRAESSDWDFITFLQPFPSILGDASKRKENVLGLDRMKGDYILYLLLESPRDDALFHEIGYSLIKNLKDYSERIGAGSDYIYMNCAGRDQNPLRGYGEENLQHLKAMARKYDSTGVFHTQCPGGWKVSDA